MFGAIWDLDGTLVDTAANHYAAWKALLAEHGRDLTYEQFRPTFGLRNEDSLVDHFGFAPAPIEIAALGARKEELFYASLKKDGVVMQPGAAALLEHLHALGVPQAIASSAPPANITLILTLLDLREAFVAIVSGEEVARGKPAPDIMLRAATLLSLSPRQCVVFEDAPAGVAAGKAAGCRVVALDASFGAAALQEADLITSSLDEVRWPLARWTAFLEKGAASSADPSRPRPS